MNATVLIRVSHALGYPKIEIVSEAGAATVPLPRPLVPAAGSLAHLLLMSALVLIGASLATRRKSA